MARFKVEFYSKSLLRKYQFNLVIPSLNLHGSMMNNNENYYQERTKKFPLMIVLSGFGDNENSWEEHTHIDELCEQYGVAALFVNGENKWYLNLTELDKFYDLVEKDLLDYVYGNFSNLSKDAPLIILGNSMGGYGAMYHYLNNVSKYDCCVALSPATHPDHMDYSRFGELRDMFLAHKNENLKVYLSIGTEDFIIKASQELDKFLIDNEVGVHYQYVQGYPHSWNLWRVEIENVFVYLKENGYID